MKRESTIDSSENAIDSKESAIDSKESGLKSIKSSLKGYRIKLENPKNKGLCQLFDKAPTLLIVVFN